jgi:LDH2 family malate/lactate/ureidoglycolate dehydrogenase
VVKKAKRNGIAMVGVNNIVAFLRPGSQAEKIARKNLIGLVFINGGKAMVAPHGGIDPVTGTNPIGIGIPTNGQPIVADMATSARAWGEVRLAKLFNHLLPADNFLDKQGRITLDSKKAYSALPVGGYKGFTFSLLFEVLTGSLVNSNMKNERVNKKLLYDYRKSYRGALFIAIDPSKFTSLKKFKEENGKLVKAVKKSRKRKGFKEILVAGERARRNKERALARGYFEIKDDLYNKLVELNK